MLLIVLAAASQLSAPTARNLVGLFGADDVPLQMLGGPEVDRTVLIRLTVQPDGHVQSCEVEGSSGIANVDAYTCGIAAKRAKFAPAAALNGVPAYAVYRMPIRYLVTNGPPYKPRDPRADLILAVNQLPRGTKSPLIVNVRFDVDEKGHPSGCSAEQFPGKKSADPQLAIVACDQLMKSYVAIPAKDPRGKAIPSVQDATVAFITK